MSDYQQALKQIDELIAHMQANQAKVSSDDAEGQDMELVRMSLTKRILQPNDAQTIERINQYYQRYFAKQS